MNDINRREQIRAVFTLTGDLTLLKIEGKIIDKRMFRNNLRLVKKAIKLLNKIWELPDKKGR